ncbi:MAG: metallophosphoesterase family protein [Gemmobacter sp.]
MLRIAVIADAHVHDTADDPTGRGPMLHGARRALRTWADTATGPRVVNESAAAFEAALTDIAARGIRHVLLLGDYTDEGTEAQTASMAARLARWRDRHGLIFHALPGNHDVWAMPGMHTATRLATGRGASVLVTSDAALAATEPDAVLTPRARRMAQEEGIAAMAAFGYRRRPDDLHWESPFGPDDDPAARRYDATSTDGTTTHRLMDASYLVEPAPGLWLLMIDANAFVPRAGIADPLRKRAFHDPGNAGWSALLRVKPHLVPWIASVAARAAAQGKTLLTFSHYPVLDPFADDGTDAEIFPNIPEVTRAPAPEVAQALIGAGIRWHMGGHMHVLAQNAHPGGLTDHSAPSTAAWPPAWMLVTPETLAVQPVPLTLAPDPALMAFYRADGAMPDDTEAQDYAAFLLARSRARALARDLPHNWPASLAASLPLCTAADLAALLARGHGPLSHDPQATGPLAAIPAREMAADRQTLRRGGTLALAAIPAARRDAWTYLATRAKPGATGDAATLGRILTRILAGAKP